MLNKIRMNEINLLNCKECKGHYLLKYKKNKCIFKN